MGEWSHFPSDDSTTSGALACVLTEGGHSRDTRANNVVRCRVVALLMCCLLLRGCEGQGRLADPPSRASMWRYDFSNPVDFNDDRVDCGGFVRQWRKNHGRCGVCGDPWDLPEPRPHETRGRYGRGIIVRNYTQAQAVVVEVEVTSSGSGFFEYQVCPRGSPWTQETQDCFTHILKDDQGRNQIPVNVTQKFARLRHVLRLPPDLTCRACILQWKYITGGRGGREEYRACADITITPARLTTEPDNTTITTTITTTAPGDTTTITSLSTTLGKFDSTSQLPEINLGYPHRTEKPKAQSEEDPQLAAPPHTRLAGDLIQNDSSDENGENHGASNLPVTVYYGLTLSLLIFRCKSFI